MKVENGMLVISILSLLICALFWYRLSQFDKLPVGAPAPLPSSSQEEEVTLEKEMETSAAIELPSGRDVFRLPQQEDRPKTSPASTIQPTPTLSTICWDKKTPLAIIDGEILAEGDLDSKSQYRVELIMPDKAKIKFLNTGKSVWLLSSVEK